MTEQSDINVTLEPEEARAAEKTGHMRYVLGISLVLAVVVIGGLGAWFVAAA